jgi:hypothetical protein
MLLNQSTFTSAGYVGTGTSVFVWGAMFNTGGVKPYQPTTDRLGYPRIDYKNGKGKLLQEPQRTNVNTYSQDFTNAVWGKYSVTVTGSAAISPDGTMNASKLVLTATSGEIGTSAPVSDGYTTIFAKAGNVGRLSLYRGNTSFGTEFNLYNGTIISGTGTIEPYKDGWYRIGVKMDANRSINPYFAGGYAVGDYVYIWGAQSEEGNFATSYIPTTSATVTRAANDVVFNSPGPTKAFASKPGVILYDFDFYNFESGNRYDTFLYNNPSAGSDYFYFANLGGSGQIYWDGNNSGGYFYAGSFTPKQGKNRSAWYFTNTNSYWYVNGSLLYTGTYFDALYFTNMQTYAVPGNNFAVNTLASIPDTSISQAQVQAWTNFNSGSGGTISYSGPFTIHTFTGSATFTPSFTGQVEVLVVAGGGGGGGAESNVNGGGGGGGGAGGLLYVSSYGVSAGSGITVTIGAGGSGGTIDQNNATNGSNSVFGGLTAIGGGRGGADQNPNVPSIGGSGGGAGGDSGVAGAAGITGQGNKGGDDLNSSRSAGGGGGAGEAGENSTDTSGVLDGTAGGDGLAYSITGFSTYYSGGGGGGGSHNFSGTIPNSGLGGLGGGGNSVGLINGVLTPNTSGVSNTGGGGGGGANATTAGNGGSGIVIVRYLT